MKFSPNWIAFFAIALMAAACTPAADPSTSTDATTGTPTETATTGTPTPTENEPAAASDDVKNDSSTGAVQPKTGDTAATPDKTEKVEKTDETAAKDAKATESAQDEAKRQEEKAQTGKVADKDTEKPARLENIPASPAAKQSVTERMMEGADTTAAAPAFVGTWTMKIDAKLQASQAKLIAEMRKKGQNWKEMGGSIVLRPNGTFTMKETVMTMDDTYEGTYKVVKGVAELTITKLNGKDPEARGQRPRKLVLLKGGKEIRRQDSMVFSKS